MLLAITHEVSGSFRHLDAFDASLDPQLLHQLPGLRYVISCRHSLPSVIVPGKGRKFWMMERLKTKAESETCRNFTYLVHSACGGNLKGQVRADCCPPTKQTPPPPCTSVHPVSPPTAGDSVHAHKLAFLSWEKAESVLSQIRRLFGKIGNQSVLQDPLSPPSTGDNGFGCVRRWAVSLLDVIFWPLSCRAV